MEAPSHDQPVESPGNPPPEQPPPGDIPTENVGAVVEAVAVAEAPMAESENGVALAAAPSEYSAEQSEANTAAAAEPAEEDAAPLNEAEENTKGMVYEDVVAKHPSREKLLGINLERADDNGACAAEPDNDEPIYAEEDLDAEVEEQSTPHGGAAAAAPIDAAAASAVLSAKEYFQQVQHSFEEKLEKLYDEEGKEYHQLPMFEERPSMAGFRNADYNRYCNILPYDATRVTLTPNSANGNTDYINANFLCNNKGERTFISTQGPLPNTLIHFWQMVWEQRVCGIVMLCNLREGGRSKCQQYWPTATGRSATHGAIKVTLDDQLTESGFLVRKLTLRNQAETREIVQFHFTDWPDHGVPRTTTSLLNLRQAVRQHCPEGMLLVHCSAGVGRSGTFIALDRLLDAVAERADPQSLDVFAMVSSMRTERYWMVQAEEQYFFLHFCVRDAVIQSLFDLADSSQA